MKNIISSLLKLENNSKKTLSKINYDSFLNVNDGQEGYNSILKNTYNFLSIPESVKISYNSGIHTEYSLNVIKSSPEIIEIDELSYYKLKLTNLKKKDSVSASNYDSINYQLNFTLYLSNYESFPIISYKWIDALSSPHNVYYSSDTSIYKPLEWSVISRTFNKGNTTKKAILIHII